MITGTKGKTTTTRMLSHILSAAGHRVGIACTDGVVIDGNYLNRLDASGSPGARMVLESGAVTAAVLETARGGLLRMGLYHDRCNVAALLNVGAEHLQLDGVETLEDMTRVKKRVVDAARDAVVLNADDAQCASLIPEYDTGKLILFSLNHESPVVNHHVRRGGRAYVLRGSSTDGCIECLQGQSETLLLPVSELPSSGNGLFQQNIANAMAAAALAEGLAIPLETVQNALRSFENSLECSPGRFNFIEGYTQTILMDRAFGIPACRALAESLERLEVGGGRICMFHTGGEASDGHYDELGDILAPHFDRFVCYEVDKYRKDDKYGRDKEPGAISELLKAGLVGAGVAPDRIATAGDSSDALSILAQMVERDDFVVILTPNIRKYLPVFEDNFAAHAVGAAS